jgi:hypothetical protein
MSSQRALTLSNHDLTERSEAGEDGGAEVEHAGAPEGDVAVAHWLLHRWMLLYTLLQLCVHGM